MHGFAIIVGQQGLNFCRSSFSIFIQAIVAGEYSRIHLEMKQGMIQWQQSKQVKLQSEKEKETGFTHSPFMELGYLNFPTFSPADGSVIAWGILCPSPPPPPTNPPPTHPFTCSILLSVIFRNPFSFIQVFLPSWPWPSYMQAERQHAEPTSTIVYLSLYHLLSPLPPLKFIADPRCLMSQNQ